MGVLGQTVGNNKARNAPAHYDIIVSASIESNIFRSSCHGRTDGSIAGQGDND